MVKSIFLYLLVPCALLLCATGATAQIKPTAPKANPLYTVTKATGSVHLNGKLLRAGCKKTDNCIGAVLESEIPKIQVGKDGFFELTGPSGKQTLYGATNCGQPSCQPIVKVSLVNKGPKKDFLVGTQAEFDQIMVIFDKAALNQQLQMNNQQLQLQKVDAPQQQNIPQKLNTKAKAGGG